jgi:hypothetical protein
MSDNAMITYYQYIMYIKVEPWMNITNMALIWSNLLAFLPTGDMGVGKSCLLHQFTEKKCE